jgi:magnesium-transporting ATPase (P-type)
VITLGSTKILLLSKLFYLQFTSLFWTGIMYAIGSWPSHKCGIRHFKCNMFKCVSLSWICFCFVLAMLGFELRTYCFLGGHSNILVLSQPSFFFLHWVFSFVVVVVILLFLCVCLLGIFERVSHELFAWGALEPGSCWSLPTE